MCGLIANLIWCYFNPRSPHRERRVVIVNNFLRFLISIHAPLTGSDASEPNGVGTSNISIHAPLTGSDTIGCTLCQHFFIFQSTLPSQGATCASRICKNISCDFNPRSPHRERRTGRASMPTVHGISIHAPLTGSDFLVVLIPLTLGNFNPRSPHRERPLPLPYHPRYKPISIHAPLTGSDRPA